MAVTAGITEISEAALIRALRAGDEGAFAEVVERYRAELHVHCYRMLGSVEDAEDVLQEVLLRAWTKRASYRGQSTFRAWLYGIATNACLDALRRRSRRVVAPDVASAADPAVRPLPPAELPWLQPYPDRLLDAAASEGGPDEVAVARETIELAFLAAIQHLPPRQRAVLILREVLGWSASETAALVETSVPAVNSALQRARGTLREHLPERRSEWSAGEPDANERWLLQRLVRAWEQADIDGLTALLREDVRMTMPPSPSWYDCKDAVREFFARHAFAPDAPPHRFVPTRANRQPAFGTYVRRAGEADYCPFAITVVGIKEGRIGNLDVFRLPELFPCFELAPTA
jgi:RNA polymerase sigma-70 factor, ECF subfamily